MEDTAAASHVPKATLYCCFDGKEDTLRYLFVSALDEVADDVASLILSGVAA